MVEENKNNLKKISKFCNFYLFSRYYMYSNTPKYIARTKNIKNNILLTISTLCRDVLMSNLYLFDSKEPTAVEFLEIK